MKTEVSDLNETLISPNQTGLRILLKEIISHRELLLFLVWKDIKVRYAQTVLGLGWVLLRPLLNVAVMTLVFGRIAKIDSGEYPYGLFAFSGILMWGYFSATVSKGALAMISNVQLVTKVYFPRVYLPMSIALGGLVEFLVTFLLFFVVAGLVYGHFPTLTVLAFPLAAFLMLLTAVGACLWLSALAPDFRDVRFVTGYLMQLLMFLAPVVWPVSLLVEKLGPEGGGWLTLYALYPMVGVIETARYALLGGGQMPWEFFLPGLATALLIFVTGVWYFQSRERLMADIV